MAAELLGGMSDIPRLLFSPSSMQHGAMESRAMDYRYTNLRVGGIVEGSGSGRFCLLALFLLASYLLATYLIFTSFARFLTEASFFP